MKEEKLSWDFCPRCKKKNLLVSELPTTIGRSCYSRGCCFWDFKTKEEKDES